MQRRHMGERHEDLFNLEKSCLLQASPVFNTNNGTGVSSSKFGNCMTVQSLTITELSDVKPQLHTVIMVLFVYCLF